MLKSPLYGEVHDTLLKAKKLENPDYTESPKERALRKLAYLKDKSICRRNKEKKMNSTESFNDIFESLENLNVSEECFDDIMGLVEELLNEDTENYIIKKYGNPEYAKNKKETHSYDLQFSRNSDDGRNEWDGNQWHVSKDFSVPKKASKSAQLLDKLKKAQFNELNQTEYARHRYNIDKVPEKEKDFVTNKIRNSNKNKEGDKTTKERTYWARIKKGRSYQPPKSDEQRVADSIARNKAKQEKNK